jgi:hypothetical protein
MLAFRITTHQGVLPTIVRADRLEGQQGMTDITSSSSPIEKLREMSPALAQTCEKIHQALAYRVDPLSDPPPPEPPTSNPCSKQLLLFKDKQAFAIPNAILRAALFPARDVTAPRRFLEKASIFAVEGIQVTFTGQEFDQTDLDVLLGILEIGAYVPVGQKFTFSAHALLKLLGRDTGGTQHEWLRGVITRLCGGIVVIRHNRRRFTGGLVKGDLENEVTGHHTVSINPELILLFGCDMWSKIDRAQRAALGRNGTAKALHGYYSSHAKPGKHHIETLAQVAGLQSKQRAMRKRYVLKAHDALKAPECGFLKDYTVEGECITVEKKPTPSQARHLLKKVAKKAKNKKQSPATTGSQNARHT